MGKLASRYYQIKSNICIIHGTRSIEDGEKTDLFGIHESTETVCSS